MKNPKFIIHPSKDNQFYFTLQAVNGQVLVTSETYTTKQSCLNGISSLCTNVYNTTFLTIDSLPSKEDIAINDIAIEDLTNPKTE